MNMQATEVKAEVEQRRPSTERPPAEEQAPAATQERSCCAVPAKQTSLRPWLIGGALLAVPLLLYAGWDWLAATGLATVLIAVGPCLAMCALGLCMGRGKSKSETSVADIRKTYEAQSGEPPRQG
jgi:hypothetical protein